MDVDKPNDALGDLSKISCVVDNDVVKNTVYDNLVWLSKSMLLILRYPVLVD